MLRILSINWSFLAALVLFSGCLTIEENYTFKKNGSGSMEYVVDMSELGEMMKSFGELGGSNPDMGTMDLSGEVKTLQGLPGISKVKLDARKEWVQRIRFNFSDVGALNGALNELLKDSTGVRHEFFRWEGSTLVRTNNRHAFDLGAAMATEPSASEDEDGEGLDMGAMLGAMKYKYSFKFAEPVRGTSHADGVNQETPNTKEIRLDTDFALIGKDPRALDLRIDLGK